MIDIDKVAQAIHQATGSAAMFSWAEFSEVERDIYRRMARAAIAAMGVDLDQVSA